MSIGSFAGVTFEVSSSKVLTFSDLSRSGSARWSVHEVNLKKPRPEFIGPGQEGLSLKISLKAVHGVSPRAVMDKLRTFKDTGKVSPFILGTKPFSTSNWYLEDISEDYVSVDNNGGILAIDATLALKEYPITPKPKEKPKPTTKKSTTTAKTASNSKVTGTITIKAGMLNCRSSPSLNGKIVKVLRKNQSFKVYGTVQGDILWYSMGGGLYVSANSKYSTFKKA
ncbi:phage tail protein [Bacillus infantis]|uniref:phage tail protein n=1 Tax=Bacillus infantis TaxID=324767 RepID=UPI00321AE2BC